MGIDVVNSNTKLLHIAYYYMLYILFCVWKGMQR